MSRLSNIKTLKIGFIKSWNSVWFDDNYYANLLFQDLKIKDYLSGLFYRLRVVSDYYYLNNSYSNNSLILRTNITFLSNFKFKSFKYKLNNILHSSGSLLLNKKNLKSFYYYFSLFKSLDNNSILCNFNTETISLSINRYNYIINYLSLNLQNKLLKGNYLVNTRILDNKVSILYSHKTTSILLRLFCNRIIDFNLSFNLKLFQLYWFNNFYIIKLLEQFHLVNKFYIKYCLLNLFNNSSAFCFYLPTFNKVTNINLKVTDFNVKNMIDYSFLNKSLLLKSIFYHLRTNIEKTISLFINKDIYFMPSIFLNRVPYLLSAKTVAELLIFLFRSGSKIGSCFFFINKWHSKLYNSRRTIESLFFLNRKKLGSVVDYLYQFSMKKSPVIGIRIECAGNLKKGTMSKVYHYDNWIKNKLLTGGLPHNTLIADIDYYQSYVSLKSSSIGIKVWLFLETHLYNVNHRYITIVY